jgi:predicted metal-dependent hydrolase
VIYVSTEIRYGTITIPYNIIKTRRVKTSELIVDAGTVIVRVPFDKDKTEIQKLVLDKARWILKKQKEYREKTPEITKSSFKENTTLPYLGNNYSLKIIKNQAQDKEERRDQAAYMALNKNLIEPLMDWKFINVEKIGARHIVSLTDEGINALRFLHEGR